MAVNEFLKSRKFFYRDLVWIAISIPIAIFFLYVVALIGQANLDRIRLSESSLRTKLTDVPQFTPLTSAEVYHGMAFASKIRTFNSNNNSASDKLSPSGATEFYEDESRRQASFVQTEAEEKTKEAETILIDISIRKKNNLALIKKRQTEIDFVSDEADVMHYLA